MEINAKSVSANTAVSSLRNNYAASMRSLERCFRSGMPARGFSSSYRQVQMDAIRDCYAISLSRLAAEPPHDFFIAVSGSLTRGSGGFASDIDLSFCYGSGELNYVIEEALRAAMSETGLHFGGDPESEIITQYFLKDEINSGLSALGMEPISENDKLRTRNQKMKALFQRTGRKMIKDPEKYLEFGRSKTDPEKGKDFDFPMFWELYCDFDLAAGDAAYFGNYISAARALRRDLRDILHEDYVREGLCFTVSAIEGTASMGKDTGIPSDDEKLKKTYGYEHTHQLWCILRHLFDMKTFSDFEVMSDARVMGLIGRENAGKWAGSMQYFIGLRNAVRLVLLDSWGLVGRDRYLYGPNFPKLQEYSTAAVDLPLSGEQIEALDGLLRLRGSSLASLAEQSSKMKKINLLIYERLLNM